MQVGGGLTHLSIETAVMASRSLTQNSSRCDQPEKIITFGKQTCRLLDKTKPYQRRKLSHGHREPAFATKINSMTESNIPNGQAQCPLAPAPCSASPRVYGKDPLDWAMHMAVCASERALEINFWGRPIWKNHPMFGIRVATDKWAIAYQDAEARLRAMLATPNYLITLTLFTLI